MFGKLFNLFALLVTMVGLALAQTQPQPQQGFAATMPTAIEAAPVVTPFLLVPNNTGSAVAGNATSIVVVNAARRPSHPGLGKLSLLVGLVTYGLIMA